MGGTMISCWTGAIGAVLFLLVFLVDGGTRPGYSAVRHPVSALALGRRGRLQTANFLVCGAAITVGGLGTAFATQAWLLGAALSVFGTGLVASGLFRMDPMRGYPPGTSEGDPDEFTRQHVWHDRAGAVVFLALPASAAIAVLALPALPWKIVSGIAAAGLLAGAAAFGAAWERDAPKAGLVQRAVIIPGCLWVASVFLHFALG